MESQDSSSPSARWQQVAGLLDAALDVPREQRAAFLDQACPDAPDLCREVSILLDAHDRAGDFLQGIDAERAMALVESVSAPVLENQRIGPYRAVRELGRGGMGTVYLAERADGQFEQQVALKLIKRGMDSEAILQRFLHERQILARLHHPNVARLLDGGITDEGQPYFAMEYVEGVTLTTYCDTHQLDVDARLRLFQEACRAVQYAHTNLVVHRDLKPSNMLVTKDGALKLLDFGIAKLLGHEEAGPATLTEVGMRVMTPEYAAPEQVRGEPVTTATDVYALGVILYELLTGHRPYQFERRTPEDVAHVIGEARPERLSAAVGSEKMVRRSDGTMETITPESVSRARGTQPERLRRRLSGDLDVVVLKALRKEPARRYPSAEAFVEDIRRHLAGMPVGARRDTVGYRTWKFMRRHKVGVAASTALALLAVLAIGFAVAMALQQTKTAREATKTEEVKNFLVGLFEVSDPDASKGETITARELLDAGAARVETELADQPEVQAELMTVVGEVYQKLGLYQPAQPLLEQALALRQAVLGEKHEDIAASLYSLASLLHDQGDFEAADTLFREALAIRRARLGETHLKVAQVLDGLASLRWLQGSYQEADSLGRWALALRRAQLGPEHPDVALSLTRLGVVARARGNYAAAEAHHREALAIRRAHYAEVHHLTAESLKNLALAIQSQEARLDEAETYYRQALNVQNRLYGAAHPEVARTLNSLASLLHMKGAYTEAEPLFLSALTMRRELLGPVHLDIATTLSNLADLFWIKGDVEAAIPLYEEALAIDRQLLAPDHPGLATDLNNRALALRDLERYVEAAQSFEEVLHIYRKRLGPVHPWTAIALTNLASVHFGQRNYAVADSLYRQALAIGRETTPASPLMASTLVGLGATVMGQGRYEEAEPLLRDALFIRYQALPEGHWHRAEVQNMLGACLSAQGRYEEAEPLLLEGYEGVKETRGERAFSTRRARHYLMSHYERQGLPEQAAAYRPSR